MLVLGLNSAALAIIICVSSSYGWLFPSRTKQICCQHVGNECFTDASPYNKMPLPECFSPNFKMFNRQTTSIYSNGIATTPFNLPASFSPRKKTVFIAHGYNDHPEKNSQWMIKSTEYLLQLEDMNIFIMDWSSHGSGNLWSYSQMAANSRVAGRGLHNLAVALFANGLNNQNSYCIGHSLGAHICGYAGQFLGSSKFGRISGLDPAGPEFEGLPAHARLSKEDAYFVDVIHTNGGGNYFFDYGSLVPMGHLDFYPNGGKTQPGCLNKRRKRSAVNDEDNVDNLIEMFENLLEKRKNEKKSKIDGNKANSDLLESLSDQDEIEHERIDKGNLGRIVGCSHGRVTDIFYESIKRTCHEATMKCTSQNKYTGSCTSCGSSCPKMGYHAADNMALQGIYYMTTSSSSPYC